MNEIKALFLVAWHSKYNPWAEYKWLLERDLVKDITKKVYDKIWNNFNTYILWLDDVSLQDKAKQINNICKEKWYNVNNSIVLEIHCNAWGWTWIEALWYNWYEPFDKLWNLLVKHTVKTTWLKDRWLKDGERFYIIKNTTPLACIFECGFIDTEKDRKVLTDDINSFSDGIYEWLKEYIWFKHEESELDILKKENKELKEKLKAIHKLSVAK